MPSSYTTTRRPSGRSREIIEHWISQGYSMTQIGAAAAMSPSRICLIRQGAPMVNGKTEEALERLTVERLERFNGTETREGTYSMMPTARASGRLQRWLSKGYTVPELAAAMEVSRESVHSWLECRRPQMLRSSYDIVMGLTEQQLQAVRNGKPARKPARKRRKVDPKSIQQYGNSKCTPTIHHELRPRPQGKQYIVWQPMTADGHLAAWGEWAETESDAVDAWNAKVIADGHRFDRERHISRHNERTNRHLRFNDLPTYEFTPGQIRKYITNNAAY